MKNKIKLGWSAVVAFALMFAATAGVVAQKNEDSSKDKIEVTSKEPAIVVSENSFRASMVAPQDFTIDPGQPINEQDSWTPGLSMCDGENELCGITFDTSRYPLDPDQKPNDDVLNAVQDGWESVSDGEEIGNTGIIVHLRE